MDRNYPIPLPFTADDLPAPLPTTEDIHNTPFLLKPEFTGRLVVRVGLHFVVKYGSNVFLAEGENMLFAKRSSTIPIPKLYALYTRDEGKSIVNYIVMEYIDGSSLTSKWPTLDATSKLDIARQLRNYFTELRQIPSPGYFGLPGKQPFQDTVFYSGNDEQIKEFSGPFDTEQQLLEAIVDIYRVTNPRVQKAEYYARILPLVFRGDKSVFTHGDFQLKNILMKDDGTLTVIDWEAAGWYPSSWEYIMAMNGCRYTDDWFLWVPKVLDEYINEFGWMGPMLREMWY
jgi:serine/threonine protein kinase